MYVEVFNNSDIEDFPLLMPRWGYVASAFTLFMIGFFGFFLNLMVMLLMFRDRQLWTPLNVILFNLVCSDFSVSVLGNPFTLMSALYHRWAFSHKMCIAYGFFMALLGIVSITSLTVLSFERYLLISRPLKARHLSLRGAIGCVMFIWGYSLILTTPPLLGWGKYVNEAANISCSVNWHEQSTNALTYILYLFAMGLVIPMFVITFSYVNVLRTMKQNSQRLGRVSRAEAKVTIMVLVMIVAFTVAWTPYAVFALLEQFSTARIISPGTGVIPALVAKSSICYDPIIYVGMNSQFRQSITRIFGRQDLSTVSQTGKGMENTLISINNKLPKINDTIKKVNSTEFNNKNNYDPKTSLILSHDNNINMEDLEEYEEVHLNDEKRDKMYREDNKISDTELSDETVCNDESSDDIKIAETSLIHNESYQVKIKTNKKIKSIKLDNISSNIHGNRAFEIHPSDLIKEHRSKKLPSTKPVSINISRPNKVKKRMRVKKVQKEIKHKNNVVIYKKRDNDISFDQNCEHYQTRLYINEELL